MVDGGYEGLQRISLSTSLITDHLASSYYEGLGSENLTLKTFVEEGKAPAPDEANSEKDEESANEPGGKEGKAPAGDGHVSDGGCGHGSDEDKEKSG
jgi:hypothetical protein